MLAPLDLIQVSHLKPVHDYNEGFKDLYRRHEYENFKKYVYVENLRENRVMHSTSQYPNKAVIER